MAIYGEAAPVQAQPRPPSESGCGLGRHEVATTHIWTRRALDGKGSDAQAPGVNLADAARQRKPSCMRLIDSCGVSLDRSAQLSKSIPHVDRCAGSAYGATTFVCLCWAQEAGTVQTG